MLEIKNTVRETKNAFWVHHTPDLNKQRISDLEDMSKGTSKSEMPRKKRK